MRLALGIVVIHVLERGKRRLHGDVVAFVAGVVDGGACGGGEYVWFAVLGDVSLSRGKALG